MSSSANQLDRLAIEQNRFEGNRSGRRLATWGENGNPYRKRIPQYTVVCMAWSTGGTPYVGWSSVLAWLGLVTQLLFMLVAACGGVVVELVEFWHGWFLSVVGWLLDVRPGCLDIVFLV